MQVGSALTPAVPVFLPAFAQVGASSDMPVFDIPDEPELDESELKVGKQQDAEQSGSVKLIR